MVLSPSSSGTSIHSHRALRIRRRASLKRWALAPVALGLFPALATAAPQSASDAFHRAYYLEHEKGDLDAAMELYRKAVKSGSLSGTERAEIEAHMAACAEEIATVDLSQLMPADTIVYAELNDPGSQLESLMEQLGLLQGTDSAGDIAVSPHLVRAALGLKGAAVAVTRVDPSAGMPGGVMILHPGDMEAVRGLIETALPAGGRSVDPIAGQPTFLIENIVYVTMGSRLILASTERQLIEDSLRRVAGDRSDSLAANTDLASAFSGHQDDLAFFCANAEPILPLLDGAIGAISRESQEAAMAIQFLDPESLRTVSGGLTVNGDGLSLDVGLSLEEGHKNIVFNLMRMPHVSKSTFDLVPSGAAAFLATSLNERNSGGTGVTDSEGQPVVTFMDLGREVFGNLVDVAVFALPSMSEGPDGMVIPDAALAMSVNDPERSKAIWRLVLGAAQGATEAGSNMRARPSRAGDHVERFRIEGVDVFLYSHGDRLVLSPSLQAIEAALAAAKGENLHQDPVFAGLAQETLQDHTSVLGVSIGRIAQVARQVLPASELEEVGPILELLSETSMVATTRHSDTELRWAASLTGLPNVGPLVDQFVQAELHGGAPLRIEQPTRGQSMALAVHEADHDHAAVHSASHAEGRNVGHSASRSSTKSHFEALLAEGNVEAAGALLPLLAAKLDGNAMGVNDFVWELISSDSGKGLAPDLLPIIQSAADATHGENWYILDTLGHVQFAAGDMGAAIKTERSAVQLARQQNDARGSEAEAALARFVKAAKREMLR